MLLSCGFKTKKAVTGGASQELISISTLDTDFYVFVGNCIPSPCLNFSFFPSGDTGQIHHCQQNVGERLFRYLSLNNTHSDHGTELTDLLIFKVFSRLNNPKVLLH